MNYRTNPALRRNPAKLARFMSTLPGPAPTAKEKTTMQLKIRVDQIKKGDRFYNEFWNKEVIATTDAYRLDGTVDPEHYHPTKPKPKIAQCSYRDGQWERDWWMIEVGVNDGNGAGGGWMDAEYRYIHVEREVTDAG